MLHLLVGQVENVEIAFPVAFSLDFAPRLVQMCGELGFKPHIVLKDEYVLMITRRDLSPDVDV
ncbi:hypothetical protein SBDP1_160029 [Syntrophobacter sp. SbD1]|nr:hypothetical protein SBDP1_160029 [Syntrophobacter sp. SbD1]